MVSKAGWQQLIPCFKLKRWHNSRKERFPFAMASEERSPALLRDNGCQVLVPAVLPQFSQDSFPPSLNWGFHSKSSNTRKLKYKRKNCFFVPLSSNCPELTNRPFSQLSPETTNWIQMVYRALLLLPHRPVQPERPSALGAFQTLPATQPRGLQDKPDQMPFPELLQHIFPFKNQEN